MIPKLFHQTQTASPSQPYTLASRTRQPAIQNLPKSMSAQRTVANRNCLLQKGKDGIQQGLRKHRGSVVFENSELLDSPPIQNFDND